METMWRYNQNIGHSQCICCGWRYIPALDPDNLYIEEWENYLKSKAQKTIQRTDEDIEEEKIKILRLSKEELDRRQGDRERSCRRLESIQKYKKKRIDSHRVKFS
jgi:hypothetical protein